MSYRKRNRWSCLFPAVLGLLAAGGVTAFPVTANAGPGDPPEKKPQPKRVAIGTLAVSPGRLLRREAPDRPWQVPQKGDTIWTRDTLVAMDAVIELKSGVLLTLLSDLSDRSPFPILESGVILNDNPAVDLDFTLDRGRVDVTNRKEKGPARLRVRFHGEVWDLTLAEPGCRVALELYGRWAPGVRFIKEVQDPPEAPSAELAVLVLKGHAELKHETHRHAMHEPPGPAYFHWNSDFGEDPGPKRMEKLPPWATAAGAAAVPRAFRGMGRMFRYRLGVQPVEDTFVEALATVDPAYRRLGLYGLGGTDNLPRLLDALADPEHQDVREGAILALRHFIGRCAGQDHKVYRTLLDVKKYSEAHAEIVMELLHSFSEQQLARSELFEALVSGLVHEKLAIRELCHWHLCRLAPQCDKDIPYRAAGPEADRKKAHDQWMQLITDGKLPPKPRK